jgi:GT2 family glycosyltransferase
VKDEAMKVGIVILNYNDYKNTEKILHILKGIKSINSIVVVDNCSTDGSYEKLYSKNDGSYYLIKNTANKGYAYGNNLGLRYLDQQKVDIAIISNPDVIFNEDLCESLIEDLKNNKNLGIITGIQNSPDGKVSYNAFWKEKNFKNSLNWMFYSSYIVRRFTNKYFVDKENYLRKTLDTGEKIVTVPDVSGCFFFANMKALKKANYFDEKTFLYYEEDILSKKLKKLGYSVGIDTTKKFIHLGGGSTPNSNTSLRIFKISCDSFWYYFKNYQSENLLQTILVRLVLAWYKFDAFLFLNLRRLLKLDK